MLFAGLPAFFDAKWSRRGLGLVLAFVLAATGLVVASAQGATAQSDNQSAAERCSEFHLFGAEPVDVAKTADGETVLAQVSWGYHASIGCFLTLDGNAVASLRAAGPPSSLPQGQTDASTRCFEHHRFGAEPVDVAKAADGETVLARLSWGFDDSIGCYLALDSAAINTLQAAAQEDAATVPDAPATVTVDSGDRLLTVSWTAPADNGGSPITVYTLVYKATTSGCPATIDTSWTVRTIQRNSVTITNLTNGTDYRLCVRASNAVGSSAWNGISAAPATTPGSPGDVEAVSGNGQLAVSWTEPAADGGASVSDYTVAYKPHSLACPTTAEADNTWNSRITSDTSTTIGGLANGTNYRVCVKATNLAGDSTWIGTNATPATLPGAPGSVEATAGDGQITVSWTAPADNGGAPITSYTVAYKANAFTCPATIDGTWGRRTTSNTTITIGGLANNNAYRLCVGATNSAGDSGWVGTSSSPSDRPGQPTGLQILGTGPSSLTVAWTAPTATGGSAITGYNVQWCAARGEICAGSWNSASATSTSLSISDLTGSTSYGVRVQAVNSRGTGPWSSTRFASTTAAIPPSTPSGLSASIDNGQITVQWSASSANGAPITHYTVECRLGGTAVASGNCGSGSWATYTTTAVTSATITGLANGTEYDIRVRATNRAGSSGWASISATPAARPRIPTGLTATTNGRNIDVSWTAPPSGGSPVTRYNVEYCSGGCANWLTRTVSGNPPATTTTLTGLAEGTTYRVRVRAVNIAGESGWSATDTATTPTRPETPTNLAVTPTGPDTLSATWTAPVSPSGITGYTVQRCTAAANQDGTWRCVSGYSNAGTAATTSHEITGLNGSTAYLVRVQAFNAAGSSGWVTAASGATTDPPTRPDAPTGFTATAGNRQIRLTWTAPPARGARIQGYTITCTSGLTGTHVCDRTDGTNTYTTTGTSRTITGLTNGTEYSFTLSATNVAGTSDTTTAAATPATRPGRPRNIEIAPSYGTGTVDLTVTWAAPSRDNGETTDNGGSDITGYTVQYRASNGNWSFAFFGGEDTCGDVGATCTHTITGLTVGPRYYVQIRTHNAGGDSSWVQASTHPTGTPLKPDPVRLSGASRGGMTATWSAPSEGASAITDYDLQWCTARERTVTVNQVETTTYPCTGGWRTAPDADIDETTTTYAITGLNGRTDYSVRVRAVNIHGNGPWSDVSMDSFLSTLDPDVPEAPSAPIATPGNRQVRLSWTAPEANGARITRYTIRCTSSNEGNHRCDTGSTNNTYTTSGTAYTISGLTNGVEYSFAVLATNSEGNSLYSSDTLATPATRPNRPDPNDITFSEAYTGGLVDLTVTWVAPEDSDGSATSGGSAITGYTLQYRTSGGNWSFHYFGSAPTTTINGLPIGGRYDVQIRTHTDAGESTWAQKSTTPTGRPLAPTGVSASSGTEEVTAGWSAPDQGASAIASYNVQRCTARETTNNAGTTYRCISGWTSAGTVAVGTTTLAISNLACGTRYGVRVQAVNSYGAGPWSAIASDNSTWSVETAAC